MLIVYTEIRGKSWNVMIVSMISRIDELAEEAADPTEAGRKMRQVYFSHCKLTYRQLTIDLLRKLIERGVGTHEVEKLAQKVIKGESRRSPKIPSGEQGTPN